MSDADDVRDAPTNWVMCPLCVGSGRTCGRSCFLCAGSGTLSGDAADDPDDDADTEEMEAGPTGDG